MCADFICNPKALVSPHKKNMSIAITEQYPYIMCKLHFKNKPLQSKDICPLVMYRSEI